MASDDPVLPPVNSTTRMPGCRRPRASAPSIIASAMRSLYEPVGFTDSSLTSTSAAPAGTTRRRRTTGVSPMALKTDSAVEVIGIGRSYLELLQLLRLLRQDREPASASRTVH